MTIDCQMVADWSLDQCDQGLIQLILHCYLDCPFYSNSQLLAFGS